MRENLQLGLKVSEAYEQILIGSQSTNREVNGRIAYDEKGKHEQPLVEKRMLSAHRQLVDYLRESVKWSRTQDPTAMWRAKVGSDTWTVRVNDFPEDNLYTIFVNDEEVGHFDEWPQQWLRAKGRA